VCSVSALANSLRLRARIAYSPLPPQHWPLCAMPPVNRRSYTVAKEISVSASLLPNVYLGYVIQSRSVLH
jgi:hypothetical protein